MPKDEIYEEVILERMRILNHEIDLLTSILKEINRRKEERREEKNGKK